MDSKLSTETNEEVMAEIAKLKAQYEEILEDQKKIMKSRDEQQKLAERFRQRSVKQKESLEEDKRSQDKKIALEMEKLSTLQEEQSALERQIQSVEAELFELDETYDKLKQQTEEPTAVPERKVVFTGAKEAVGGAMDFALKSRITYPMEGGSALVTFEEAIMAQNILRLGVHKVKLEKECVITLEAKPVQFLMPCDIQMDTHVCPRRVLVSNLPAIDSEVLLDKLELYFSRKTLCGGGEVVERELLSDSGNVVITFVESDVAKVLCNKQYHDVNFGKGKKHRVKVTPFLNGEIIHCEMRTSKCDRTLLLTGIPAIMDQESLQDLLEIHFQKASNGGGEVDAFLYNPLGQQMLAVFEEDPPKQGPTQRSLP